MKKTISKTKKVLTNNMILLFALSSVSFAMESNDMTQKNIERDLKEHIEANIPITKTISDDVKQGKDDIKDDSLGLEDKKIDILNVPTKETINDELKDEQTSNIDDEVIIEELADDDNNEQDSKEENVESKEDEVKTSIDVSNLTSEQIRALGRKLRVVSKDEQKDIINALKILKEKASPATSEILASIHEKKTSFDAVDILINIGNSASLSGLARLISNQDTELSNYILKNLVKLKSKAEPIVAEIYANFQNKELKENVINALGEIQGDIAFYELKELLKSKTESQEIRILTLRNFKKFKDAKKELPLLRRLFRQNAPSIYADELSKTIFELEEMK